MRALAEQADVVLVVGSKTLLTLTGWRNWLNGWKNRVSYRRWADIREVRRGGKAAACVTAGASAPDILGA